MTLGGTLDFQGQSAQSLRFLESVAINAALSQNVVIDALLAPMDQGIVVQWVATGAYVGNPVTVFAFGAAVAAGISNESRIQSGRSVMIPILGQAAVQGVITPITLTIQRPADAIGPAIGTLLIYASSAPIEVSAVHRWDDLGHGTGSAIVNIAATTTATVLAAPVAGYYWRIKCLSWWVLVAPAANQRITWSDTGLNNLVGTMAGPTFPLQSQVSLDLEESLGIQITNNASVTISAIVAAELWPRN